MDYTFATIIVADADKAQAQADLGSGFFTVGMSPTGRSTATHWISSGAFDNMELDRVMNEYEWNRRVYFGYDSMSKVTNLKIVIENIS